ncbi:unnamed protein product [Rhodiola kirilowii]
MIENLAGEVSLNQEFEALRVSKRLVRTVSQNLRKRSKSEVEEKDKGTSLSCLSLYNLGGGCKVSAEMCEENGNSSARRRSSTSEDARSYRAICGAEETGLDCFSYGVKRLWNRHSRRNSEVEEYMGNSLLQSFLPDDVLEMCLMRLPMTSLMNARLVCKRWRHLATAPRLMQMRREHQYQTPWLFLFGTVRNGYCSTEIHALDMSLNQWHRVDSDILKGRFLFSVAGIRDSIYIVGGCTSLSNYGKPDKTSFKTHKGVFVFSPLNKSWRKSASLKHARSSAILGVCEVSSDCLVIRGQQSRQDRRFHRSRGGGSSEVYEDPHRHSVRVVHANALEPIESSSYTTRKPAKMAKQRSETANVNDSKRFVMIAVGGLGPWDEALDSGEMYDSLSNKWVEIQRLPLDFGTVCSGVVCSGLFYVYSEADKLAAYDIERGFWVSIQTAPSPSSIHGYTPKLISCSSRFFMLSVSWCESDGQIGRRNKAVRKLWELDLMYLVWKEVCVHPDAPMDWNAAFTSDKNLIFGVEMFKIFGQVLNFSTVCNVSESRSRWTHVSRNHMAMDLDASSCATKTMAVLHL